MAECAMKRSHPEGLDSCDDSHQIKKFCSENVISDGTSDPSTHTLLSNEDSGNNTETRVTEDDVGITEYISDHPGFHAVMKER